MAVEDRDAFDLALVATALVLSTASAVGVSNPVSAVGAAVAGITSMNPVAYLVVLGVLGVLFTAYAVWYVPSQGAR